MSKLWVCGRLIGEWNEEGSVWAFQGIFDDDKKAVAACRDATYFIFSANLNESLPHEDYFPEDGRYPIIEKDLEDNPS